MGETQASHNYRGNEAFSKPRPSRDEAIDAGTARRDNQVEPRDAHLVREVHTTEVVCFLWQKAQPASLTLRSHARMSTCYKRQLGTALLRPQNPRYPMPQTPKSPETPQISKKIRFNEKPTADQWANEPKEQPRSQPLRASHSPQTN